METKTSEENMVVIIELERLQPMKGNRSIGGMPKETLEELAASIRAKGILHPLIVRTAGAAKYKIIAGERRWKAADIAGLASVPCQVRDVDDAEADQIRMIENLQRENLHPLDEAEAFARLLERGASPESISEEIGRSPAYIHQRMVLRRLIPAAEKMMREGKITAGHGAAIARLGEDGQVKTISWINQQIHWHDGIPTIRDIEEFTKSNILLNLSSAAFKKDDADLCPDAGACTGCKKRSGYEPALFADVGKADMCLDAACFNKKLDLVLQKKKEQLEGEDLVLVNGSRSNQNIPGTVPQWSINPCKASEKGAKKTLIVAGPDRGKIGYTLPSRIGVRVSASPAEQAKEKARRERELAEQRIKKAVTREIYDTVIAEAEKKLALGEGLPIEVLRAIAGKSFNHCNERQIIAKMEGWKDPNCSTLFKNMDEQHLILTMLKCLVVSAFANYSIGEELKTAAKAYGVDAKGIEKRIRTEAAAKKEKKKTSKKAAADPAKGKKPAKKGSAGICRVCGCTQENPCPQGCGWTDRTRTLCTACADKKGKRRGK